MIKGLHDFFTINSRLNHGLHELKDDTDFF